MESMRLAEHGNSGVRTPEALSDRRYQVQNSGKAPISDLSSAKAPSVGEEDLRKAVEKANKLSGLFERSLKFEYRKEADIYQVSVLDTTKDEVVRKIPPDEVVRFIETVNEMFGSLLDMRF